MIKKRIRVGEFLTNCYILGDENTREVSVFDPGDDASRLKAEIEKGGYLVKYYILTHGHYDHVTALEELKSDFPAPVCIHKAEAEMFDIPAAKKHFRVRVRPDVLLSDGDELSVGAHKFLILHTPGHSAGSICVKTGKILISGDTLFKGTVGRTDFYGGSFEMMLSSLARLMELPDETEVHPGHYLSTSIGRERAENEYVGQL